MQCVRPISHRSSYPVGQTTALLTLLVTIIALGGNSYAASRDSRATLHISVTLVTTIGTQTPKPVEPSEIAASENQDIIYNLRPGTAQSLAEAIMSTSPREPQEKSLINLENLSGEESVVEVTTVVMK